MGPAAGRPAVRVGEHDWGRMEWLVEEESAPGAGFSLARMVLNPGMATPTHRHPNCHEALTLLEGSVIERLDGDEHALSPGQTFLAPAGAAHGLRNTGDAPARMMVVYSAGRRLFETVPEPPAAGPPPRQPAS
ncbi:MAG TPA: cupin domain-containing protein [bacterium]|nr:cupin domain-containing protein [bacterium]